LSPFKANLAFSDVLLPIAPFSETAGTFVNAEGRVQGFHAVVRPLAETRPGWKVLRVLANLLKVPGFDFESAQDVLAGTGLKAGECASVDVLSNKTKAGVDLSSTDTSAPVVASLYQLDSIVRRASTLQLTADARHASSVNGVAA
jgi:NADH-quinone oxidoreductase subunit G